jgi:hypothetical protein
VCHPTLPCKKAGVLERLPCKPCSATHACRLLFPLESLDEGLPLLVELWDKDFGGIEFLGQVCRRLEP